jgi:hypothetical protein
MRLTVEAFVCERAKGAATYPSKVRVTLRCDKPGVLWSPGWKPGEVGAQHPHGCGLEARLVGKWSGVSVPALSVTSRELVRAWVGLDPSVVNPCSYRGRMGALVVPVTDEVGLWGEIEIPL